MTSVADERLRSLVSRIEAMENERSILGADIKDLYSEVKSAGYKPKLVRKLIADRKRDQSELEEERAELELYRAALGDFVATPLGQSAMDRAAA